MSRPTWRELSAPLRCVELAAAMRDAGQDRVEMVRRLLATGRWPYSTVLIATAEVAPETGYLLGVGKPAKSRRRPTERARVRRALQDAPEHRACFHKIRRCGIGADEALRALGLKAAE